MSLDKMKVEFYLKTFGDSMSKLNQINSYSMILNSITQDELRCISPRIINDLQQVRMITTYDSIAHHANNTQKLNESVTDNLKRLRDLRNSLAHLKLKINNNQNSFFNTDYRQILAEVAKIEPILHSNLDSNFTISAQMISSLDVKVISSLNKFSGINSKAQILVQQVESSKTSYWLEDYNEILSKIKVYKENHTSINYSEVLNLIDSKSLIKSSTIDVFVKANYFLLSETGLIKYINSNLRNRMISKREFVEFSHSALKWKGAKVLFYKIRALLIAIGKFLIKRSTLKYLAIISCIILAIIVIISYWMQILIIGGVILLTIGYFNSKK
jgi:hypothetical protein